jgi:hypothetical protein
VYLTYKLKQSAKELEAAAAVGDVARLEHLLFRAASCITSDPELRHLRLPPLIQLATMSPVPAAVECLVAAGASVLEEDTTMSAWETTTTEWPESNRVWDAEPIPMYWEDDQQYSCLLLAAHNSPSSDMVPLLTRITLRQAKQQWSNLQQQQQQQQQAAAAWGDVLFDLVKGPMCCCPHRAAAVVQQVAELEGAAAARGVVTRLLEEHTQLQQQGSRNALTHLSQLMLLVWLGVCGEVVQQRVTLVTPLQQACGVLLLHGQQAPLHQAQQLPVPPSWGAIRGAAEAVAAAVASAAGEPAAAGVDRESSAGEAAQAVQQQERDGPSAHRVFNNMVCSVEWVFQRQAAQASIAGDVEQPEWQEETAKAAAVNCLGGLLKCFVAEGSDAAVVAAAAELRRQLLAAWWGGLEQLQQEMVEGVVGAVQLVGAGARRGKQGV